jgi:hypothetical protein
MCYCQRGNEHSHLTKSREFLDYRNAYQLYKDSATRRRHEDEFRNGGKAPYLLNVSGERSLRHTLRTQP